MSIKQHLALTGWLLFLFLAANWAALSKDITKPEITNTGPERDQSAWITEEWMGDEEPYKKIRREIDQFVQEGQDPLGLARTYRVKAQDWRDPLAQYRWAYPAYLAHKKKYSPETSKLLVDARFNLDRAGNYNPPRNYEYAHLRFLVIANTGSSGGDLATLGKRLVERDPKDYEVRFLWAGYMGASPLYNDSKDSKENVQVLLQAFPQDPKVHLMSAGLLMIPAAKKRFQNQALNNQAIAAYKKVQGMVKSDDQIYKSAQFDIDLIRRMQKWYAAHSDRK